MPTQRFLVRGKVQGVGFRAFVAQAAKENEIEGEVWNTRHGDVEIIASHDSAEALESFSHTLRTRGPGRVDSVQIEESTGAVPKGFFVGPTR